jgi:hypothetical protein
MEKVKTSSRFFSDKLFYLLVLYFILGLVVYFRLHNIYFNHLWSDETREAWCALRIFSNPSLLFSSEIIEVHPPLFPPRDFSLINFSIY